MNTILIINDNKAYREDLIELLNLTGYMTLEAENGLFGLQIIKEYLPDLIICDIDMPVMNGIKVMQSLRNDSKLSMIPFLILSSGSDERSLTIAKDLEMGVYLTKGISIASLLSIIAHFLPPIISPMEINLSTT